MAEHRTDKKDGWQRYDWTLIELDYVFNPDMSLRKIAKKYGCNLKTVARHSKKDEWFRKRRVYLSNIAREAAIMSHIRMCYDDVLEVVNETRIAHGLEPWEKLSRSWEKWLREEVEKLY